MKKSTIIEIIIFLYIALFLYSGISKLMEYSIFKEQLAESPVLPPIASVIATALPCTEFLVVLLLIIPRWRLKGLYVALCMMIAFTLYIIALLYFSDKLPCSCGGIISQLSWKQHIIFNGAFITMSIIGILLQKKIKNDDKNTWETVIKYEHSIATKEL